MSREVFIITPSWTFRWSRLLLLLLLGHSLYLNPDLNIMTEAQFASRPSLSGSLTSRATVGPEQENVEPARAQAVFVSDVYALFEGRNNNTKSLT
jgi:hypothetical protein